MAAVNFTAPIIILLLAFIIGFSPLYHADFQVDDMVYSSLETSFSKLPSGTGLEALHRSLSKPKQSAILFTGQFKKFLVLALLLLGGDVELNPGPNFKYPCGMCVNQRGVQCDICDCWFHTKCMFINSKTYEDFENLSTTWLCPLCEVANFTHSLTDQSNASSRLSISNSPVLGPTNIHFSSTPARSAPQDPAFYSSSWSSLESSSSRSEAASLQPVSPNILIANFQGIRLKVAKLSILIDAHKVDTIIACETHLTADIRNSERFSSDFTVYRKDRNHCGGGVLIAGKNHLASLPHPDLDANCEIAWAEVIFEGESLLISSFYRPPSADEATLNELDISLKKAVRLAGNRHILVGGSLIFHPLTGTLYS